jgi:hypothetical protein
VRECLLFQPLLARWHICHDLGLKDERTAAGQQQQQLQQAGSQQAGLSGSDSGASPNCLGAPCRSAAAVSACPPRAPCGALLPREAGASSQNKQGIAHDEEAGCT